MKHSYKSSVLSALGIFAFAKLISYIKVTFAIGSFWTLFSLRNSIAPLSGAFGGVAGAGFFFVGSIISAMLFKKAFFLASLAFSGIPTLFSSLYWATESRWIRVGIPVLCMMLFVAHAQGAAAWPYALFWLIPIVSSFFTRSIFAMALGSTFTAHAVGSVIWLYATSMPAAAWYTLMPQVPVERLLFATGMYLSYHAFAYLFSKRFVFGARRRSARA